MIEKFEFTRPEYDPDTHFWLKVTDENHDKLKPMFHPGERILVRLTSTPEAGSKIILFDKETNEYNILICKEFNRTLKSLSCVNLSDKEILIKLPVVKPLYMFEIVKSESFNYKS